MNLQQLRYEIDQIDTQMVNLFVQRMETARKIAEEKSNSNSPVLNTSREKEILARVSELSGKDLEGYTRILFHTMFDLSKSYQTRFLKPDIELKNKIETALQETANIFPKKATVACQGVEGAYSQIAAEKMFEFPLVMYFNGWNDVFNAVEKNLCQYGILPIENSSCGSVGEVYDLLRNYNCHIIRGIKVKISHALLAKPGTKLSDIKEIYSHEQAIGQCAEFLKSMTGVKVTVCENTAMAAELVAKSERSDIAAISSKDCSEIYSLQVVKESIQLNDNNFTRFICISKKLEIYPGANKLSLLLSIAHRPTALYHIIAQFSALGLNLARLESRPIPGSDFEFMHYLEMDTALYSPEIIMLLCQLSQGPEAFMFLGSYTEVS